MHICLPRLVVCQSRNWWSHLCLLLIRFLHSSSWMIRRNCLHDLVKLLLFPLRRLLWLFQSPCHVNGILTILCPSYQNLLETWRCLACYLLQYQPDSKQQVLRKTIQLIVLLLDHRLLKDLNHSRLHGLKDNRSKMLSLLGWMEFLFILYLQTEWSIQKWKNLGQNLHLQRLQWAYEAYFVRGQVYCTLQTI